MTRTYTIDNHQVTECVESTSGNHWRLWDIIEGTLALSCFIGVLGAAYILFA